jgi:hypothetical protein
LVRASSANVVTVKARRSSRNSMPTFYPPGVVAGAYSRATRPERVADEDLVDSFRRIGGTRRGG